MPSTRIQSVAVQSSTQPSTVHHNQSNPAADVDRDVSSILKAVRAFEHNRQRAKKAEDHARTKVKKERSKILPEPVKSTGGKAGAGGKGSRKTKPIGTWDEADVVVGAEDATVVSSPAKSWAANLIRPEKTEVKLADLISANRKSSRPRDSDFEMIPHVPSVIVLDDTFLIEEETSNAGPDEPWEHILSVEDEDAKANAPSYAQVVSQSQ
ncbi:hypothetical protein GLOTRDRAFT_134918 [Gloeophyllum trabeum ATCC 11539]|uniref:Uncharacterized protein n=1 Tax=Gloeophyllum trabeum (strain ATCC 11539 / FP-39264 / Madison 617) TaxID=670483 RepID=S7QKB6_GLOTA|nr:uncharacterized protein GLOTRDRAFT_134918 [Gloeophyllum trabeum ATCC 11539]EPQ60191.1 hypothetical protein GLOTRDRAFT_134918 [Gloeophyllum trabeum ATCC 11539]